MRYCFCILCSLMLTAALPAALCAAPASPGNSAADAPLTDARFAALDADGNGRVTWEEFHTANESISRQGFDLMDINKNGELSLEEWRAFTANHGMSITMPPTGVTLPARPVDPPAAPTPGVPSLPLIMPPANPDNPADAAAESGAPASPAPARVKEPSLPLLMPPAGSAGPTPPQVTPPAEPSSPALPPVTPPAPTAPAAGSSEVHPS